MYRIDLRSVLKANALPTLGTRETPWVPVITLQFLDNERLVATIVTRANAAPVLAEDSRPDAASPFWLRSALLDVPTGKVLATPEWPSNSRAAGIVAVNERGFVTETGGELTLLSPDFVPLKRMPLPSCVADGVRVRGDDWYPNTSWSGGHTLLSLHTAWSKGCWLWIDTKKLQVLASWEEDITGPVAVSDNQLVWEPFGRHFGDPPSSLKTAVPAGHWNPIPSTLYASTPHFAGPDLLYFQVLPHQKPAVKPGVYLMHTDTGNVSRVEPPRKDWGLGPPAASRTGIRFVIPLTQLKGSHPTLDIGGSYLLRGLLVYDAPFRIPSYTLQVRNSKARNASAVLSPDGRHLAVLGYPEPVLEVFDLPPVN